MLSLSPMTRRVFIGASTASLVLLGHIPSSAAARPEIAHIPRRRHLKNEDDQMRTPIRLAANEKFIVQLHSRSNEIQAIGWIYLVGMSGSATLHLVDGATTPAGQQFISSPGMIASSMYSGSGKPLVVEVAADSSGFQGEVCFDLCG
jgi:hypothetical protein